jgi:RND family efflux transporter MFP subunit
MNRNIFNRSMLLVAVVTLSGATASCSDSAESRAPATDETPVRPLPVENIYIVREEEIRTGPALSGSLEPETRATIRAELSGAVLETSGDAGRAVNAGELLARIDGASLRDAVLSAQSSLTTARHLVEVAQREVERSEALEKAGAIAPRQVEQARTQLVGARAQEADARARLTNVQEQMEKTVVRSPFRGVISARSVSAGDIVSPGTALFTIINPSSMRLEATVPSAALGEIRIDAPVEFTVSGYPSRRFAGRISAISPIVDPATRQVRVIVSIPNQSGTLVAGLFAEGRVASDSHRATVVPFSAVDESGVRPWVLRVRGGLTERVETDLGLRDPRTETIEVRGNVLAGDTLLIGAARGISPNTAVRVSSPNDAGLPPAGSR